MSVIEQINLWCADQFGVGSDITVVWKCEKLTGTTFVVDVRTPELSIDLNADYVFDCENGVWFKNESDAILFKLRWG